MQDKNIFLTGDSIILRPLQLKDIEGNYRLWLNDPQIILHNSHGRFPQTPETLLSYVNAAQVSGKEITLAVIDKNTGDHIGNISLQNINWIDRNAEIAFLLGESKFQGKGVMFEAGKLLIDHGFKTLNLHRIYCGTSSANTPMQRLAEKLEMIKEGIRKEAIYKNGKYFDIIEYGLINKSSY